MTERLSIDPNRPDPAVIERAGRVLAEGGLVVLPTETVYGVACDPAVPGALERLIAAKGRPPAKPFARLAPDVRAVRARAVAWTPETERLAEAFWPGPLTLVLETAEGWTGFRVPDHPVPLALARRCDRLLALTSANRSGGPDPRSADEIDLPADLLLDGGPVAGGIPSTVVRIDGAGRAQCLREGALPFSRILETLAEGRRR